MSRTSSRWAPGGTVFTPPSPPASNRELLTGAAFMEKEYAAWRRARPAVIRGALGGLRGFPVCIQHAASSGVTLFPPEQFADLQNCKIAESSGGRMLVSMGHSR